MFLYELLCQDTPFYSESLAGTYAKILAHRPEMLKFPSDRELSRDVIDLLRQLLSPKQSRLGSGPNGVANLKAHPFFTGLDWGNIRALRPPFVPEIHSACDAKVFLNYISGVYTDKYLGYIKINIRGI